MSLFVLTCVDYKNALDRRMAAREAHLAYVAEHRGLIKVAGPLLDDAGQMAGSMFVLEVDDAAAVEAFTAADPYRLAGLFERTEIRAWRATIGGFAE